MQQTTEAQKNRYDWYAQTFIKFELVKQLKNKYMSCMFYNEKEQKMILKRYFFGYSLKMLEDGFDKIGNIYDKRLYADLAYWNQMLTFSWDTNKRLQQKEEWDILKKSRFDGIDFAIDLDADDFANWDKSYKECKKVVDYFDNFNVPYSVRWSGSRGFHIVIDNKHFLFKNSVKIKKYIEIASYLKAKLKLKTLDISIYDIDRILKLPYSIDCKTGLVVLPLNEVQFNNFYPSMCYPENVIRHSIIKNRGLCERKGDSSNVKTMLKEIF